MQVKTQRDELENYLIDASNLPGGYADKLFIPETTAEIAEILKDANEKRIPVTVSGARTGTVGGAIPFGGYLISLEKFNRIKRIDKENLTATVGAGVLLNDFQKAVEAENLFYPPDPTEWSCQLGGTVATNASGARSFKYGATREFVTRLEIVLPNGQILNLKRGEIFSENGAIEIGEIRAKLPTYAQPDVRKNTSGYYSGAKTDAIDLFIGSEGTLGIITEIDLKLLPKPESFFSGIIFFENEHNLLNFVNEARAVSFNTRKLLNQIPDSRFQIPNLENQKPEANSSSDETNLESGIWNLELKKIANRKSQIANHPDASLIEYFDKNALEFISEKFSEIPANAAGAIFFEQETTADSEDELLEKWNELLEKHDADLDHSWFTTGDADREKMRAFRHALPVTVNERIVRNRQKKVGTDMAVPDAEFASFLKFYKEKLDASGLEYVIFGHIGDNHLHANMIPKDDSEAEKARHLYGRFIAQAIMLGGTISAEHGIGKHKTKYLYVQYGERFLNEMAELKKAFDPHGILGRGNMFDQKFLQ